MTAVSHRYPYAPRSLYLGQPKHPPHASPFGQVGKGEVTLLLLQTHYNGSVPAPRHAAACSPHSLRRAYEAWVHRASWVAPWGRVWVLE